MLVDFRYEGKEFKINCPDDCDNKKDFFESLAKLFDEFFEKIIVWTGKGAGFEINWQEVIKIEDSGGENVEDMYEFLTYLLILSRDILNHWIILSFGISILNPSFKNAYYFLSSSEAHEYAKAKEFDLNSLTFAQIVKVLI